MDEQLFRAHVIKGHQPGPRLLITAGVHGDEFEPMAAVERLAGTIGPDELAGTLVLIPVVNENAMNRAARRAEDGLDLARTCPGKADGTITQRIAAKLSTLIRSATHYIDLHTGGIALSVVPLGGYTLHRDSGVLATQREMAKAFNLPYVWGTTATLQGRTLSVARDANVPAIYVEHGGGVKFNNPSIDEMIQGCMNIARYLGMIRGGQHRPRRQIVIEDDRPASGHLQVQTTAPITGLFESCVALGETVSIGDPLGVIRSPLTGEQVTVRAQNGGILFMLRILAAVQQGDALAAIVDPEVR